MTPNHTFAIAAGSGLNLRPLFEVIESETPFQAFPGLPASSVSGHPSRFIQGRRGQQRIILQEGRLHLYEGWSYAQATQTVDILASLGANTLIFTNVTGALDPTLHPGDLVAIHNLHLWPCTRWPQHPTTLTPARLPSNLEHHGTYMWMHGPCYETPAEINALRHLGGTVVGMSTAPELARCQELNLPAAVISCVTNVCGAQEPLTHTHVLETAQTASIRLINALISIIDARQG